MASGGSTGFIRSNAARNWDTNSTSPFVPGSNVQVAPKLSSVADTVAQPSSPTNPMAGCSTSWSSVSAWTLFPSNTRQIRKIQCLQGFQHDWPV